MNYNPNQFNRDFEEQYFPPPKFNPNQMGPMENLAEQEKRRNLEEIRVVKYTFNNVSFFDRIRALFLTNSNFACVFTLVSLVGFIIIMFECLQIVKLYGVFITIH